MVEFLKRSNELILRYTPENRSGDWLVEPLERDTAIPISGKAFYVSKRVYRQDFEDAEFAMDPCYHFVIGVVEGEYYRLDKEVLGIQIELFMERSIEFKRTTFVAERNICIFRPLHRLGIKELWIGGDQPDALPREAFDKLLKQFPNSHELDRYARARVGAILRNHLEFDSDPEAQYQKYMSKKESVKGAAPRAVFATYERDKFSSLIKKVETMLSEGDVYTESRWQAEIVEIIQFLFPKYIRTFTEAPVHDSLKQTQRYIDFLAVDASGYIDVIEIKKPFLETMLTKNSYRHNHVPMRELSGTVMQLEKYIYHLNRWGEAGEKKLNEKFSSRLPPGLEIKIVNPSGLIIMGRDTDWTPEQRMDFEVIRRKYRHVFEIMTYDDLLRRLKVIRDQFGASVVQQTTSPSQVD